MKTFANPSSSQSKAGQSHVIEHSSNSLNLQMSHSNLDVPSDKEEKIVTINRSNEHEKKTVLMTLDSQGELFKAVKNEFKDISEKEFCEKISNILDDQNVVQLIVHKIKSLNCPQKDTSEAKTTKKNDWHLKKLNSRKRKSIQEKNINKEINKSLENKEKKDLFNKKYRLKRMSKDAKKIKKGSKKMAQLIPSISLLIDKFISNPSLVNIEHLLIKLWNHVKISKDNFDHWDLIFTDKSIKINSDDKKFIIKQLNLYVGIRDFFRNWDIHQESQNKEDEQIELQEEQKINYEESKIIKKRELKKKFDELYKEIEADFNAEKELNRKKNIKDINIETISL